MKKIGILLSVLTFSFASAQTDTLQKDNSRSSRKNPDGTVKITKTYEGTTKPNTNAVKNNTTGSPVPVRKPTDTTATPSGTMGPDRAKGGNTTKSTPPNGNSANTTTGTIVPKT